MTVAYFDASALVKLVVAESGSMLALSVWNAADVAATSRVGEVEVAAAIEAATRAGRVPDPYAARRGLATIMASLRLVEVTADVVTDARDLTRRHPLSGFDAIHLASALVFGPTALVVTWDRRLLAAATAEGHPCVRG